jgi:hypothetical protein
MGGLQSSWRRSTATAAVTETRSESRLEHRLAQRSARLTQALLVVLVAASLVLRLHALDVFLTTDENLWAERSANFAAALRDGRWEDTYQSVHPGVVTMWIGTVADSVARGETQPTVAPHFPRLTLYARRIIAFLTWLGVLAVGWLLSRAFDAPTVWFALALLAFDPFYLALSRVHHLDALLATFSALAVVSLLVYVRTDRQRYLLVAGAMAGLAVATKSPAAFLFPWALLVMAAAAWRASPPERSWPAQRILRDAFIWGVTAAGVISIIWPAVWVDAIGTAGRVLSGAAGYAQSPHEFLEFFRGEVVDDPGPAFYPIVWLWRTTPAVLVGLGGLAISVRRRALRGPILVLVAFALGYVAFMTLAAKKLERYILPAVLVLDILAAVGWTAILNSVIKPRWRAHRALPALVVVGLALSQLVLLWPTRPYYFAYYNPLGGGARTAPHVLRVGYGEGLEKAAAYLNRQPQPEQLRVATTHFAQFAPFFRGRTYDVGAVNRAVPDYYVLYRPHIQRRLLPDIMNEFYTAKTPEQVVGCCGIDYAWIYPNSFYAEPTAEVVQHIEADATSPAAVIITDIDAALQRHYTGDLPFVAIAGPPRDDFVRSELAQVTAGRSHVWLLTFPGAPGATRDLIARDLQARAHRAQLVINQGVQAVHYELRPGATFTFSGPAVRETYRLGDNIRLLGYDLPQPDVAAGESLTLRLYWQADGPIQDSYTVFTHLIGPDGRMYGQQDSLPQGGGRPTGTWSAGETIVDEYDIEVAASAPPGEYRLAVGMYTLADMRRLPVTDVTDRHLPDDRILIDGLHIPSS